MYKEKENILRNKSFLFAKRVVKLFQYLKDKKCPTPLLSQLIRSGTSIGANVEEAIAAESKRDFLHKLMIARKEVRETEYWIRLLSDTDFLSDKEFASILSDCKEILKILTAIIKTMEKDITQKKNFHR